MIFFKKIIINDFLKNIYINKSLGGFDTSYPTKVKVWPLGLESIYRRLTKSPISLH